MEIKSWVISLTPTDAVGAMNDASKVADDVSLFNAYKGESGGRRVDHEAFSRRIGYPPTPGMIGCAASHQEVYQLFLKSDADWALVLEDDARFTAIRALEVSMPLLLQNINLSHPTIVQLGTRGSRLLDSNWGPRTFGNCVVFRYSAAPGQAFAYLINRTAASKLISSSICGPADWPNSAGQTTFYGFIPPMAVESGRPSTIEPQPALSVLWRIRQLSLINYIRDRSKFEGFGSYWRVVLKPYVSKLTSSVLGTHRVGSEAGPQLAWGIFSRFALYFGSRQRWLHFLK
jgi:hypothetical protein